MTTAKGLNVNRRIYLSIAIVVAACSKNDGAKSGDTRAASAPSDSAAAPANSAAMPTATGAGGVGVGMQYDSLPSGYTYRDGSIIPPGGATRGAEYDLAHVTTPKGDVVWLDSLGAPAAKGRRSKTVRAQLAIPKLANDERLFMASCDANGKLDPLVVAIVVNENGVTKFTKIRQAWRANISAARFDLLPVAGITCEDPGA